MDTDFTLLAKRETMWAEMLMDVLKDNGIPCVPRPVYGVGLTIRAGVKQVLAIYVPSDRLTQARQLYDELFSSQGE